MENNLKVKRLGTMVDLSRNATMNKETIFRWIDTTADIGYNALYLYLEDTYELDDNPYFGYKRGGYSQKELKEIDDYAFSKGMEVIPCIQTLAHLDRITKWPMYSEIMDMDDILLIGEEKVYELIDKMFASFSKCVRTKTFHIGMDEAWKLTRGKYQDIHGLQNPTEVLISHLNKVSEIGKKYGLQMTIWSDMFFRLATGGEYYISNANIDYSVGERIPDNITLCFWDYYHSYKNFFDGMIKAHEKLKKGTCFAGGLWTWKGYAPNNRFSIQSTKAAMKSCLENGVDDVFFTLWGDDGSECSKFAILPSLFYAAEAAKGNFNLPDIKKKFKDKYGISFDRFCLLDVFTNKIDYSDQFPFSEAFGFNPEKYLLFNDPFLGLFDNAVGGFENDSYKKLYRKLNLLKGDKTYGYLFEMMAKLCDALSIKAELGTKTRKAYEEKDLEALNELRGEYKKAIKKTEKFYEAFRNLWYIENKGYGMEVHDIRFGGLITRLRDCERRLGAYVRGEIDCIDELEEKVLDYIFEKDRKVFKPDWGWRASWADTVSRSYIGKYVRGK